VRNPSARAHANAQTGPPKTTIPKWACTPSPYKFFTLSTVPTCYDAAALNPNITATCPMSVSKDGLTFEDVRVNCHVWFGKNPFVGSTQSVITAETSFQLMQNCTDPLHWGWSGNFNLKKSTKPCPPSPVRLSFAMGSPA